MRSVKNAKYQHGDKFWRYIDGLSSWLDAMARTESRDWVGTPSGSFGTISRRFYFNLFYNISYIIQSSITAFSAWRYTTFSYFIRVQSILSLISLQKCSNAIMELIARTGNANWPILPLGGFVIMGRSVLLLDVKASIHLHVVKILAIILDTVTLLILKHVNMVHHV